MGLLYYVPKVQTHEEARAALEAAGAGYACERGASWPHVLEGPEGGSGVVCAPQPGEGGSMATACFDKSRQRWRKAPGQE
ncbi:MAG: hypothetical protein ACYS9X_29505, partial [Planctomycetota bacterium]